MCYVRSKAKGHGKGNQIEGKIEKGQKVVVVEDLISTGGSAEYRSPSATSKVSKLLGVVSIFTYELKKADEAFASAKLSYTSLTDFGAFN